MFWGRSPSILTLQSVLTRVEEVRPLLKGSQTEKMVANGKLLKALGVFEPTIVNEWELELGSGLEFSGA